MYLDSSVLIDYYAAEGLDVHEDEFNEISKLNSDERINWCNEQRKLGNYEKLDRFLHRISDPETLLIRDLFKTDKNLNKIIEIRDKIYYENIKVLPVFSPLALNELMKWNAEVIFKQVSAEAVGTKTIQREGEKKIGDKLKIILGIWKNFSVEERENKINDWKKEGVKRVIEDLWLNPSFTYIHGLSGLIPVSILNFNYTMDRAWQDPSAYAYLQLGATDIMHILFAQHLGCKYIASFDSDFKRAKDEIQRMTGIEVLYGHNEILKAL